MSKHAFYPFIHKKLYVRRFRREINYDGTRSKKRVLLPAKSREVYFSNHLDSNIYSFYAELLNKEYEKKLKTNRISECITAYRKIKCENRNGNKCNIDFANEVFSYIKSSKKVDLVAITFDIKSFFDNLNHKYLKTKWKYVINSGSELPKDHYNIFRNITKFSYVEENDIFEMFKAEIIVESKSRKLTLKNIDKKIYLRNKGGISYCLNYEVEKLRKNKLIKANKYFFENEEIIGFRDKGIPQGSPISSILANIYMLDFDKEINDFVKNLNGIYRRYSDDMIVICDLSFEEEVLSLFRDKINETLLEIQESKTQIFQFKWNEIENRHTCNEKNQETNKQQNNTNFEYLGFQFDGQNILLKNSSLASFYRKMKRTFARGWYYTLNNRTKTNGELFKNTLYKRFTHLGSQRRFKYERDKNKSNIFHKSYKYDWGNFITYAKMAARILPDNKIKSQIKRHWLIFHDLIKERENK